MENIIYVPETGNWFKNGNIMFTILSNLTDLQIDMIEKFVSEHNKYYICDKGRNQFTLCKRII